MSKTSKLSTKFIEDRELLRGVGTYAWGVGETVARSQGPAQVEFEKALREDAKTQAVVEWFEFWAKTLEVELPEKIPPEHQETFADFVERGYFATIEAVESEAAQS